MSGGPEEWPENRTYEAWTGPVGADSYGRMTVIYRETTIPNFAFARSDFGEDGTVTVNAYVEDREDIDPGSTFAFRLGSPERGGTVEIGRVTYEGDAEPRALEEPPEWAANK